MKKVAILFKRSPYGTALAIEGVRIAAALTAMDEIEVHAVFMEDAVFALTNGQNPKEIDMGPISQAVEQLPSAEVNVYVLKESLKERGLSEEDLVKDLDYEIISLEKLSELIAECDFTFTL